MGSHVVTNWLDIGDATRLDTAYCSHISQAQFRAMISGRVIRNNGGRGFPIDEKGVKWLVARCLTATNVRMSLGELLSNNAELALILLEHFAPHLQRVRFDTSGFYLKQEYSCHKFLFNFAKSCQLLTHLTIGLLPEGLHSEFLRNLAKHCPHLSTLALTYFNMVIDRVDCDAPFPSLRQLRVRFLIDPDTVCLPYLIRCSPLLESAQIAGACGLTPECVNALRTTTAPLHTIALFGVSMNNSMLRQVLLDRAPGLKAVTFGGRIILAGHLSDALIIGLAQSACMLETLSVLCPNSLTDAALAALADHCHHLQHLHIVDNATITNAGVKTVANKCKRLQSVKFLRSKLLSETILFFFASDVSVEYSVYVSADVYSPPSSPVYTFPYASIPADGLGTAVNMPIHFSVDDDEDEGDDMF